MSLQFDFTKFLILFLISEVKPKIDSTLHKSINDNIMDFKVAEYLNHDSYPPSYKIEDFAESLAAKDR